MSSPTEISRKLDLVRQQIKEAATNSGRDPDGVQLLAVSKTYPPDTIRMALDAGQLRFGENRVQEILDKSPDLPDNVEWHLIGHLQKNKVRKVLPLVTAVHSVDSIKIAESINRIAGELGQKTNIYLQINIAGDEAKFGFSPDEIRQSLDQLQTLENLQLQGLMTIPLFTEDMEKTRGFFANLRLLRDELSERSGLPLSGLSMGMSHDFPIAVEEGATIVRVGSAIFGQRH